MDNSYSKKIEEDIRQHKLYTIQVVEQQIREYQKAFDSIKEKDVVKLTKNATSVVLRVLLTVLTVVFVLAGLLFLFPELVTHFMEEPGEVLTIQEKNGIVQTTAIIGIVLIVSGSSMGFLSIMLKKYIRKRKRLHDLSKLMKSVIGYMNENVKEEKKQYESFVNGIAQMNRSKEEYRRSTQEKF